LRQITALLTSTYLNLHLKVMLHRRVVLFLSWSRCSAKTAQLMTLQSIKISLISICLYLYLVIFGILVLARKYSNSVAALLSLIFCQEMSFVLFTNTVPVFSNALKNWRNLWDNRAEKFNSEVTFELSPEPVCCHPGGFVRHSYEFYMLALAKLKYLEKRQKQKACMSLDESSMDAVRNLILQVRDNSTSES
jgi:hypothetical protein